MKIFRRNSVCFWQGKAWQTKKYSFCEKKKRCHQSTKSIRRHSQELGISVSSVCPILKNNLHLHSSKIHLTHELKPTAHKTGAGNLKRLKSKSSDRSGSRILETECPHTVYALSRLDYILLVALFKNDHRIWKTIYEKDNDNFGAPVGELYT